VQANVTAIKQYHFITVNTTSGLFRETYSITATHFCGGGLQISTVWRQSSLNENQRMCTGRFDTGYVVARNFPSLEKFFSWTHMAGNLITIDYLTSPFVSVILHKTRPNFIKYSLVKR